MKSATTVARRGGRFHITIERPYYPVGTFTVDTLDEALTAAVAHLCCNPTVSAAATLHAKADLLAGAALVDLEVEDDGDTACVVIHTVRHGWDTETAVINHHGVNIA